MTTVTTESMALALCLISLVFWGVWANTWKMTTKWRFELYALDFFAGVGVVGLVLCLTVGFYASEITFLDNLTIVRLKQIGLPGIAGALFALGIMLYLAGVSIAGMAVATAVSGGVAVIVGAFWTYLLKPGTNPVMLLSGSLILGGAVTLAAFAYRIAQKKKNEGLPLPPSPVSKRPPVPRHSAMKGNVVSAVSGLLLGSFFPALQFATTYEVEIGAFALLFVFVAVALVSGALFSIYFFNLPVEGKPVALSAYFKGPVKQHAMGFVGGALWVSALAAHLVVMMVPEAISPGIAASYPVAQGAATLLILTGLAVWNEFTGAPDRARLFIWLALPVFHFGVALVALAPRYAR